MSMYNIGIHPGRVWNSSSSQLSYELGRVWELPAEAAKDMPLLNLTSGLGGYPGYAGRWLVRRVKNASGGVLTCGDFVVSKNLTAGGVGRWHATTTTTAAVTRAFGLGVVLGGQGQNDEVSSTGTKAVPTTIADGDDFLVCVAGLVFVKTTSALTTDGEALVTTATAGALGAMSAGSEHCVIGYVADPNTRDASNRQLAFIDCLAY